MSETVLNGRYRLVAQQGSGGMAVIYKAVDQELGRTVAVKILRPSLTNDLEFLSRFRNEARAVANLSHPNIVTVFDVGNQSATHYIVMEFVEGYDLKRLIRAEGALGVDLALDLAIQICAGIGFAHRAGLVHADIKPQNILLTRDNKVKVTDFGIAQALSDTMPGERQAVVWGSPHYFAPEQARGEKPSPASDVYSIGIVLFEMLTGRLPYTGTNQQELAMAHIRDRVPTVAEFNPNVPESLSRIVQKTMSKEPTMRYRMVDQLGQILSSYRDRGRQDTMAAASRTAAPPPPSVPEARPAPSAVPAPVPAPPLPPPQQTFQRPLYASPQAPVGQMPSPGVTQRASLAPEAPSPIPAVPGVPAPFAAPAAPPMGDSGYTSAFPSDSRASRPLTSDEVLPQVWDTVTLALAFLAAVAVACLIPLYILVLQAYL